MTPLCKEAESCSCGAADNFNIVKGGLDNSNETVGLYNECKCDFWLRLCEDTGVGEACDYAAEYCCGDYMSYEDRWGREWGIFYLQSPQCYCDFFNYAQNQFGHTLKTKAMNVNEELPKPCGQFQNMRNRYVDILAAADLTVQYLIEVPSLVAIYNRTNGPNWKNSSGWMKWTIKHCNWHGISCDDEGFVSSINLRDNNLTGQFPTYTKDVNITKDDSWINFAQTTWVFKKYGLGNLYNLKMVDLADNKLTGTIDYRPLYNLHSLSHFDVSGNQLSGEVDALVTPSLTHVDFSNNRFTSMPTFKKYKGSFQTLRFCDVSNNAIQEDAADLLENIPTNIEQFFASTNEMHGNLPASLNNLPKLRQFNMASNALSGELPVFADSTLSLKELDISFQTNGFTGSIPEDLLKLQFLNTLNLASNKLAGTIPRAMGLMAMLEVLDLSNNHLHSSIPSELGMPDGSLKRLNLSNNALSGRIPSEIGQLHNATILLKDNRFHNSSAIAPLSLCTLLSVDKFDLENDTTLCPIERNALSDFYDSAKGAEWTDRINWTHEYASYCYWKGVTCDDNGHVTNLTLANNGLSGRLSESIGHLTFIEVLDLSDNDIKGSIPAEIGLLENLTYLRLSYNAFTGTAPKELGELTKLQLLQLQSNRITNMSNIPRLNDSLYNKSTFVTDCGVPSAFDEPLECERCTMCCNSKDDCHPQEETQVAEWGLKNYGRFAALVFGCFIVFCGIVALLLYECDRRKNHGVNLTLSMETRMKEDHDYALSKIGKNSVYSYFLTDKVFGWLAAFATVGMQIGILVVFILASEPKLQDDKSDIKYTWKCPRDTDVCKDKSDLDKWMWAIFCVLMVAFLAKDMISGSKLIYHSAKVRHTLSSRVRYFFGGTCLCSITLFALYVSIVYNKAIATRNTELIVNSVIVLFVMEMDEWIFAALEAANEKWTAHAADEITIDEMKKQIASQQEELRKLREIVQQISLRTSRNARVIVSWNRMRLAQRIQQESQVQKGQIASQKEELRVLRKTVEKIQGSQAAAQQLQLCYDFT